MRRSILLLAVLACALISCTGVVAEEVSESPARNSGGGGMYAGGHPKDWRPDMSVSAADGSELAPYDPFRINKYFEKTLAERAAKRQAKVEIENQRERCQAMRERAARREANERREAEEERRENAREAKRLAKIKQDSNQVETELMEVAAETDADADSETEVDGELLAELEADMAAEVDAEAEADADIAERSEDMSEMEADVEEGAEADADVESESDASNEGEAAVEVLSSEAIPDSYQSGQSMIESEAEAETEAETEADAEADSERKGKKAGRSGKKARRSLRSKKIALRRAIPASQITYNNGDLAEQTFANDGGRAVFARRAAGATSVRFEKLHQSSSGNAVVNGVTKLPCGKEITDKGLFGAVVKVNPGPTVEAADPQAPVWKDDVRQTIWQLPVVPQFKKAPVADEYGDMPQ